MEYNENPSLPQFFRCDEALARIRQLRQDLNSGKSTQLRKDDYIAIVTVLMVVAGRNGLEAATE